MRFLLDKEQISIASSADKLAHSEREQLLADVAHAAVARRTAIKQLSHINEIISDSFGLWISSLFSAISGWNLGIPYEDHKEVFFWLVEHMLRTGKIKFIAPGADCYVSLGNPNPRFTIHDIDAQWQAPPNEIINYLREHWPSHASRENDPDLLIYFYEIPGVIWVSETGELVAS